MVAATNVLQTMLQGACHNLPQVPQPVNKLIQLLEREQQSSFQLAKSNSQNVERFSDIASKSAGSRYQGCSYDQNFKLDNFTNNVVKPYLKR